METVRELKDGGWRGLMEVEAVTCSVSVSPPGLPSWS